MGCVRGKPACLTLRSVSREQLSFMKYLLRYFVGYVLDAPGARKERPNRIYVLKHALKISMAVISLGRFRVTKLYRLVSSCNHCAPLRHGGPARLNESVQ